MVMLRHEPSGDTTLVGSHFLDWRVLLLKCAECSEGYTVPIELMGVAANVRIKTRISILLYTYWFSEVNLILCFQVSTFCKKLTHSHESHIGVDRLGYQPAYCLCAWTSCLRSTRSLVEYSTNRD